MVSSILLWWIGMKLNAEAWYYIAVVARILCVVWRHIYQKSVTVFGFDQKVSLQIRRKDTRKNYFEIRKRLSNKYNQ